MATAQVAREVPIATAQVAREAVPMATATMPMATMPMATMPAATMPVATMPMATLPVATASMPVRTGAMPVATAQLVQGAVPVATAGVQEARTNIMPVGQTIQQGQTMTGYVGQTVTVTGVDRDHDGVPDVLQRGAGAKLQLPFAKGHVLGAPEPASPAAVSATFTAV